MTNSTGHVLGVWTSTTITEMSERVSQKVKNRGTSWPSYRYTAEGLPIPALRCLHICTTHNGKKEKENIQSCACVPRDKWVIKILYTYTVEFYSAMKENETRKKTGSESVLFKPGHLGSERQKQHPLSVCFPTLLFMFNECESGYRLWNQTGDHEREKRGTEGGEEGEAKRDVKKKQGREKPKEQKLKGGGEEGRSVMVG